MKTIEILLWVALLLALALLLVNVVDRPDGILYSDITTPYMSNISHLGGLEQ